MKKATVREALVPWVLALPVGTEFSYPDAKELRNPPLSATARFLCRIENSSARVIFNNLIEEGFLKKNQAGRRVSYTRTEWKES